MEFEEFVGLKPASRPPESITGPYNTTTRALISIGGGMVAISPVTLAQLVVKLEKTINTQDRSSIEQYEIVSDALQAIFNHDTIGTPNQNTEESLIRWSKFMNAVEEGKIPEDPATKTKPLPAKKPSGLNRLL